MSQLSIQDSDVFYGFHIGDGLDEYTMCKYTPIEIDNANDKFVFKNHQTEKIHHTYRERILSEMGKTPLEAAIKFVKISDLMIKDNLIRIERLKDAQIKALEKSLFQVDIKCRKTKAFHL